LRTEIEFRAKLLREVRSLLDDRGFVEVTTPVARRFDCGFRPRPVVDLEGQRFLRESVGPALRFNLQFIPKVYEIGPCFRHDALDSSHSPEFTMLDLYASGEAMEYLYSLAEAIVRLVYPGSVVHVSVAEHLKHDVGVDPWSEDTESLRRALVKHLRMPSVTSLYDAVERYMAVVLVPQYEGCVLFRDMPLGTEVCARIAPDSSAVLRRFEIYINGVEVVHGYEDETDLDAYEERADAIGFFNEEQQRVVQEIRDGRVPGNSVGCGVGIERLCAACTGTPDIRRFLFSPGY